MIDGNFYTDDNKRVEISVGDDHGKTLLFTDDSLNSLRAEEGIIGGEKISMGNVISASLNLRLFNFDEAGEPTGTEEIEEGDSVICRIYDEHQNCVVLSRAVVEDIERDKVFTNLKCCDELLNRYNEPYIPSSGVDFSDGPISIYVIAADIVPETNYAQVIPSVEINGIPEGISKREMIGLIACCGCCNFVLDREGGIGKFIPLPLSYQSLYTLTPSNTFSLSAKIYDCVVEGISINSVYDVDRRGEKGVYSVKMEVENELCTYTQGLEERIWSYVEGLNYRAFEAVAVGNPLLECGDAIDIIDTEGQNFTTFIFSVAFTYNGALTMEIRAGASADTDGSSRRSISRRSDSNMARTIKTQNSLTRKAIEELAGKGGGVSPELMEVYTDMKKYMLRYDSDTGMWVFLGNTPTSYVAKNIVTKGTAEVLQNVTYAQPVDGGYATAATQVLTVSGASVYYTAISGSDAYKYITTVPKGGEYAVRIPKIMGTVDFEGIFAKEITSTDDMAGWNVGEIGYILTSI